ncbi:hypothetical protein HPP92_010982 [Vanilla planifolia]|uniref:Protein kinase domain-containing protein n=1 Tax=Vanilla planifolia TaxID=51239 RepID=A0A835QWQ8_VANPL|nr:hypothetical protein HPP92_010982 [Vanilla planifolia]
MAVIRERRLPKGNLTLQLPIPEGAATAAPAAANDCCKGFSIPRLQPVAGPAPPVPSGGEHRLSDFEKIKVLGQGNGGTVYQVRHRRTGAVYALKTPVADDTLLRRQVLREVEILRSTDSNSVVRCHGVIPTPSGDVALLLEHMDAGSLESILAARGNRPFSEPALADIARQRKPTLLGTRPSGHRPPGSPRPFLPALAEDRPPRHQAREPPRQLLRRDQDRRLWGEQNHAAVTRSLRLLCGHLCVYEPGEI